MIRSKGFPLSLSAVYLWRDDTPLKAHLAYQKAKAGDKDAALELAELSNYIQVQDGVVRDVVVLVNAGRNPALVPAKKFVRLIKERFDEEFTATFGIEPEALTANEAQYLVGFQSIDQIRNRLAAAEQEIDCRLRSKGIARPSEETPSGALADQGLSLPGQEARDL